jgi:hypothetical protein
LTIPEAVHNARLVLDYLARWELTDDEWGEALQALDALERALDRSDGDALRAAVARLQRLSPYAGRNRPGPDKREAAGRELDVITRAQRLLSEPGPPPEADPKGRRDPGAE